MSLNSTWDVTTAIMANVNTHKPQNASLCFMPDSNMLILLPNQTGTDTISYLLSHNNNNNHIHAMQ